MSFSQLPAVNKIEGTPILKLAMVKNSSKNPSKNWPKKCQKNSSKNSSNNLSKSCQKILQKNCHKYLKEAQESTTETISVKDFHYLGKRTKRFWKLCSSSKQTNNKLKKDIIFGGHLKQILVLLTSLRFQ